VLAFSPDYESWVGVFGLGGIDNFLFLVWKLLGDFLL
jgi:hypothetical protein